MCGRFTLKEKNKVKAMFGVDINPSFNICPGTKILTIDKNNNINFLNWGYRPVWAGDTFNLINARSETIFEKPSFKNSRRCLIIADGYFEWKKEIKKVPYYFHNNNKLFFFGGLFNETSGCCIVTKESEESLSFIHNRQPLIIDEKESDKWLQNEYDFSTSNRQNISFHKVSNKVNSPKNNSPENIMTIED
ncbi:MAG: DUF159 family protein [Rhodospirillaceae bacterium]|nr:DUF159 family protein [Rhodospirillaceae bacterium]